jgi:DNA-binding PadR family transcriptional regulator
MTKPSARVREFLPLRPAVFHILVVLAEGERHGYAIKQEVEKRTDGVVKMGPGTLYESIQRMQDRGLIEELSSRPQPDNDQAQRRYYKLSKLGREVLSAEVVRLGAIVADARASLLDTKPA